MSEFVMIAHRLPDDRESYLVITPPTDAEVHEGLQRLIGGHVVSDTTSTKVFSDSYILPERELWRRGAAVLRAAGHTVVRPTAVPDDMRIETMREQAESLWHNPAVQ